MDAKKDYSHVISGYRNELRLNGKATLSAYCRSVGVSISAVHHWMENYGITTKKIKAEWQSLQALIRHSFHYPLRCQCLSAVPVVLN
jgi:hypothetical protein